MIIHYIHSITVLILPPPLHCCSRMSIKDLLAIWAMEDANELLNSFEALDQREGRRNLSDEDDDDQKEGNSNMKEKDDWRSEASPDTDRKVD